MNGLDEKELQQLIKRDSPEAREAVAKVESLSREVNSLKEKVAEFQSKKIDDYRKPEFDSLKKDLTEKKVELKNAVREAVPNLNFDTPKDRSVFYSGTHGRETAENFCKSQQGKGLNYQTIEMTSGGKWLEKNNINDCLTKSQRGQVWRDASLQYAQSAKGKVVAYGDISLSEKSHLWKTEVTALHRNKEVTGIDFKRISENKQSEIKTPSVEAVGKHNAQQKSYEQAKERSHEISKPKDRDKDL